MNVLVMSHFLTGKNRIFEDYCTGIHANSSTFNYIDYRETYLRLGKRGFERYIEELILKEGVNCVIFLPWSGDMTVDPRFLKRLSDKYALIINFFDTEYYFEAVDSYYGQAADLVIVPDYLPRFKFEMLGIPCLSTFSLFDRNLYKRIDAIERGIDVSFVGNVGYQDRKSAIDFLLAHGVEIETFGAGSTNGFVDFDEMIQVFNRSKINLNFTGIQESNIILDLPAVTHRIRQSKGRPIEVALCGGFVLSAYSPGIEEMFHIGEEIDVFRDEEELVEKIRYYLANDNKREAMAQRAHERALRDYDCREGFKKVFAYAPSRTNAKTMFLDRDFLRHYSEFHIIYIVLFLVQGKPLSALQEVQEITRLSLSGIRRIIDYFIKGVIMALEGSPRHLGWMRRIKKFVPWKVRS